MIIPISTQELKIGDKVITIKELYYEYCVITTGHEFYIVDYDKNCDRFVCEDINKSIFDISKSCITKKVSLEKSKKEHIFKVETIKYKDFIVDKCPNKYEEYDNRDVYDACKLKNCYGNFCVPTIECAKHLSKDIISKSIVLSKHLRLNKLNKLRICSR